MRYKISVFSNICGLYYMRYIMIVFTSLYDFSRLTLFLQLSRLTLLREIIIYELNNK